MHIVVWADLWSTGIHERPPGRRITQQDLAIPDELWFQFQNWVKDYDPIIDMKSSERLKNLELIRELDSRGLELTTMLKELLGTEIQITYESEGLLTEMKNIEEFDKLTNEFETKYCRNK